MNRNNSRKPKQMPLFHRDILQHQLKAVLFYWGWLPTAVLGSGLLLDRLLKLPALPLPVLLWPVVLILATIGILFISWSTRDLERYGAGTPSPMKPARQLITQGSYRLCRHPMFFGYDLLMLAALLALRSPAALVCCYPLYLFWSTRFLRKEEQNLALRFKETYLQYQQQVPFLLPRFRQSTK